MVRAATSVQVPASAAAVRNALLADINRLVAELPEERALSPAEVHECRKRLKRLRASLALVRPALDARHFRGCDDDLRRAGKALSRARNVAALAQAERDLIDTDRRRRTRGDADGTRSKGSPGAAASKATIATTKQALVAARRELRVATVHARGWPPLGDGLRRVYRRGRRGVPDPSDPGTHQLHAWRRHVKRYWHLLEAFEPVNPRRIRPLVRDARLLSDVLGKEHDLALLEARLLRRGRENRTRRDAQTLKKIGPRRARLAARAIQVGRRLYAAKPRLVETRMHRDWLHWRARRRA